MRFASHRRSAADGCALAVSHPDYNLCARQGCVCVCANLIGRRAKKPRAMFCLNDHLRVYKARELNQMHKQKKKRK